MTQGEAELYTHPPEGGSDRLTEGRTARVPRDAPMIHIPTDPPLCEKCQKLELSFFDPNCSGCADLLSDPSTTIPQVFAILRQWTPQTQQSLEMLIREILSRGAHVNDRDGLTDMTLLHYAAKAGANGMGDVDESCRMINLLISKGADVYMRCRWTHMAPLHYATYFDTAPAMTQLLETTKGIGYKYIGAKNYLRRSISAYDVNNSKRDVTKDRPSDGYPEEAFIVDQSQPHVRSKSEYSLEKVGQKNHSEACTKLRPPILVVTKENEDKDAPATETKEMGNEESKASVAKQPDEAGNNAVPLETSDSKDTARKEQNADTKQMVSKQSEDVNEKKKKVAKERKGSVARERKASVVKENDAKETKVENGKVKVEESLLSEVGGLDEYELNEAGIAYMYGEFRIVRTRPVIVDIQGRMQDSPEEEL